jgi:uncharacterized cupin superfamily protein
MEEAASMSRRRIVTGFNEQGQSIIVSDGPAPASFQLGSFCWEELWAVEELPTPLDDPADPGDVERVYTVRPGALMRAAILTLPPESERASPPGTEAEREAFWQRVDVDTGVTWQPDYPKMHSTPTLDVIVVLAGKVEMELDSGQIVRLGPGDSVIQRGTMHAWRVIGDEPCTTVGFMVQGSPHATASPPAARKDD